VNFVDGCQSLHDFVSFGVIAHGAVDTPGVGSSTRADHAVESVPFLPEKVHGFEDQGPTDFVIMLSTEWVKFF
jgi:hypothetical protein